MKLFFVLLVIPLYFLPHTVKAELQCQWTTFTIGGSCSEALDQNWKKKEWIAYSDNNCQQKQTSFSNKQETTVCCCKQISTMEKITPKYMIIGSLIFFFGLIAGYFVFIKPSQEN